MSLEESIPYIFMAVVVVAIIGLGALQWYIDDLGRR